MKKILLKITAVTTAIALATVVAVTIPNTAKVYAETSARVRVNETRYVNVNVGSVLNFRTGAGTNHSIVTTVPRGTDLHILYAEGSWGYTTYKGKYGWVSLDYVSKTKPGTVTIPAPVIPKPTTPATPVVTTAPTNPANTSNRAQWLKSLIGTPAVEWGNSPGTQCVELPKWYAEQLTGKSNRYVGLGNGNTLAKGLANYHGWDFSTNGNDIKVGDVVSFNGTSSNGFSLPYGHVVIVYEVTGNTFKYIDQWAGSNTIRGNGTCTLGRNDITGRARPNS